GNARSAQAWSASHRARRCRSPRRRRARRCSTRCGRHSTACPAATPRSSSKRSSPSSPTTACSPSVNPNCSARSARCCSVRCPHYRSPSPAATTAEGGRASRGQHHPPTEKLRFAGPAPRPTPPMRSSASQWPAAPPDHHPPSRSSASQYPRAMSRRSLHNPAPEAATLRSRLDRAGKAAADAGADALLIAPGSDLRYLVGQAGGSFERLTTLVVPAGDTPPALVVPKLELPGYSDVPTDDLGIDVITWVDGDDPYRLVADQV